MTTLYLNAPREKTNDEDKKSYADTLRTATGNGYAVPKADAEKCLPGCGVVLLCQDEGRRAEGTLKAIRKTGDRTRTGMLRYDVQIEGLAEVPYSPPPARLGRTGTLVSY